MQNGYRNGQAHEGGLPPTPLALLLVESDGQRAERMERRLIGALPGLVATRCGTLAAARAYLSGTAFDAVCTADELPDGSGTTLLALRDRLGLHAPVFVWTRAGGLLPVCPPGSGNGCVVLDSDDEDEAAAAIGRALGSHGDGAPRYAWDGEALGLLEALRSEAGAVAHAINNPLTVIAGNAQLLGELARMGELDATLTRPVEDIERAAQQLNEALGRLAGLRQRIAVALGVTDRL
jgi:signal transduction histidine kinase